MYQQMNFLDSKQLEVIYANSSCKEFFLSKHTAKEIFLDCHETKNGLKNKIEISFFTSNKGKVQELEAMIEKNDQLHKLASSRISIKVEKSDIDVDEDQDTYIGNAIKKANAYSLLTNNPVLTEDSGFSVPAFGKFSPDVFSARYESMYEEELKEFVKKNKDLEKFYNEVKASNQKDVLNKLCLIMHGYNLGFENEVLKSKFITVSVVKYKGSVFIGTGELHGLTRIPFLQELSTEKLAKHLKGSGYNSIFSLATEEKISVYSNLSAQERSGINLNHRTISYCESIGNFLVSVASESMK